MSDERDDREGSERDDRQRPPERGDREADEPLGDLAEEVRERTGKRRERRERRGERRTRDERADRSEREGPLADVAAAVDERRTRKRGEDDAFESVDVGEVDGEQLWEELAAGGEGETASVPAERSGDGAVSSGATADATADATVADATTGTTADSAATDSTADWVADAADTADGHAGREVRTIPKATCHGCPHFGDPPELACTHEGTDILAMVDSDHFRVADCPMVVDGEEDIGSITDEENQSNES